jgi:hypothetical protein
MSIETLTGDEFMNLDSPTHRVALAQYEQAVDASVREVTLLPGGPARTQELDRLTSLLTLRKVHKVRLEELEGEELVDVAALPATYPNAELDQLPA